MNMIKINMIKINISNNRLLFQLMLSLGILCYSTQVIISAKEVEGLFEVSVPVADQSNAKRNKATRLALNDLVVRISGLSAAANNSIVKASLKKSSTYIQRYAYREEDIISEDNIPVKQLMLDLNFDEISLRNLLRDAELPRWASNRPQVLFWIAIGNQQQRFLMGTDDEKLLSEIIQALPERANFTDNSGRSLNNRQLSNLNAEMIDNAPPLINLREIITNRAASRGIPILLPLMDLEDSMSIDTADVWGRFVMPIRGASIRYHSDAVLAVQIINTGDQWKSHCLLLHGERTHSWEQEHDSLEAALIATIDSTTDEIAREYVVLEHSMQRNELLIAVTGIEQIADFALLMTYFQELTSISSVNVARVNASTVQLHINLIGELQAMLQAISLDNRLLMESTPIYNESSVTAELPSLYFRWNREFNQ